MPAHSEISVARLGAGTEPEVWASACSGGAVLVGSGADRSGLAWGQLTILVVAVAAAPVIAFALL